MNYGTINAPASSSSVKTAREAFEKGDPSASRLLHQGKMLFPNSGQALERHSKQGGKFLKSVIYGGLDGILTGYAIVTGAMGANLSTSVIIILGVSSLVANSISMGIGDIVSTNSYLEHVQQETKREEWEFDLFPEGEIEEMVDLYEQRGLPREKAEKVIGIMAKYKKLFIEVMVREELGLIIPDPKESPAMSGFFTFISFFVFGSIPLLCYCVFLNVFSRNQLLGWTSVATLLILFVLGVVKSKFSSMVWWKSGLEFTILGMIVAFTAFYIGGITQKFV